MICEVCSHRMPSERLPWQILYSDSNFNDDAKIVCTWDSWLGSCLAIDMTIVTEFCTSVYRTDRCFSGVNIDKIIHNNEVSKHWYWNGAEYRPVFCLFKFWIETPITKRYSVDETKIEFVGVSYEPNCCPLRHYCSRINCHIHFKPNTEYYPTELYKTRLVLHDR